MNKSFLPLFANLLLAAMIFGEKAHGAALMTEAFDYSDAAGTVLTGIGGWTTGTQATIQDGNLTYPGLTDPIITYDKKVRLSNANGLHSRTFNGSAIGSGSVYVSFLFKLPTLPTTDNYYFPAMCLDNDASLNLNSGTGFRQARAGLVVYCQRVSSTTYHFGIRKNESSATTGTTTWAAPVFTTAETVLVVGKYTFGPGAGDDTVTLWINPGSLGGVEDGSPAVAATTSSNPNDSAPLQYVAVVSASNGNGGGVPEYDNILVGQTWADVTPAGPPPPATKLGFTTQPSNAAPGATMAPVVVQVQSATGISVPSNGVPVTLTLTAGSGTLSGTVTQMTDGTGKATFNDLSIDVAGTGKQLTASASGIGAGLTNAVSNPFTIVTVPIGSILVFSQQPANAVVNTTLNGVIVQIQDTNNAAIASNGVPITLTLTSGSGTLNGTVTRNTDSTGKAVFNDLSIDTDGTGKQLTASASGIGTGLTDAISNPFEITLTAVGAKLAFTTQPSTAGVNAPMSDIVVQVRDNNDAAVSSNGVPITLTLTLGTGTLSGTTTQNTDGTGKATFSGLSINSPGLAKQLTASASGIGSGLSSAPSAIFAITNPPVIGGPVITQTLKAVSSVILRGTNGAPGGEYRVLNSSNLTLPSALWSSILTNTFNGNGGFDCTNPVSPAPNVSFFRLLSIAGAPPLPDFGLYGFATRDASGNAYNVTGGTNGSFPQDNVVTVSNYAQLGTAISNTEPMIIQVVGEIYMRTNGNFYVRANKTIVGVGTNATLIGCLGLYGQAEDGAPWGCSNIIIRNITLRNPDQFGEDDGIAIKYGAHHIWVDHCTFHDVYDGTVDVTRESDFVTVSWCKFFYNSVNAHGDTVNLIGADDGDVSDLGKLHVTFHHNWWGPLCRERMPSVRFGRVHVYNNYFNSAGNHYCTRTRLFAEVLVENNYFDNVFNPWELATSSEGPNGKLRAIGNITNNCTFSTSHYSPNLPNSGVLILVSGDETLSSGTNQLNPPPYSYPVDAALNVPTLIQTHAGAGKGPFAP